MMNDLAIRVEGLSKKYRIGQRQENYRTIRDVISSAATMPLRRVRSIMNGTPRKSASDFWALTDVCCEVKRGSVVGVIGPNGAGKSTLLKILSRIASPTEGYADLYGRVGSLLEVGSGFHSELTGRENVYLNGSILGMKRSHILRCFDEIVDFAGVSQFIDTPVKHYSSGMYLRLAFAVAAHLETEILLVDEVLAVGDAVFQRKCLGKMSEISAQGRTILFVSHNLGAITELCDSSIVLHQGRVAFTGNVVDGIGYYTRTAFQADESQRTGARWVGLRLSQSSRSDIITTPVMEPAPFQINAAIQLDEVFSSSTISCIIRDAAGNFVVRDQLKTKDILSGNLIPGVYELRLGFPSLWLSAGVYTLCFKFVGRKPSGEEAKYVSERIMFEAVNAATTSIRCLLSPQIDWDIALKNRSTVDSTELGMDKVGVA